MTSVLLTLRDTVVAAALLAMVFAPLEWAFTANAHQPWRRPRIGLDVAFFLGSYLLWGSVAIWMLESLSVALGGWVPSEVQAGFASQPWWLQALEVIALSDLGIYGFHRACHSWEPLWRIHRVHHCPKAEERFELGLPEPIPLGYFKMLFGIFMPRTPAQTASVPAK